MSESSAEYEQLVLLHAAVGDAPDHIEDMLTDAMDSLWFGAMTAQDREQARAFCEALNRQEGELYCPFYEDECKVGQQLPPWHGRDPAFIPVGGYGGGQR